MPSAPITPTVERPTLSDIRSVLRGIDEPETGMSIIDLGLVYAVTIDEEGVLEVTMSLPSPASPIAPLLRHAAWTQLRELTGVEDVEVNLVWDPPGDPRTMASDEVRRQLGIFDIAAGSDPAEAPSDEKEGAPRDNQLSEQGRPRRPSVDGAEIAESSRLVGRTANRSIQLHSIELVRHLADFMEDTAAEENDRRIARLIRTSLDVLTGYVEGDVERTIANSILSNLKTIGSHLKEAAAWYGVATAILDLVEAFPSA